MQRGLILLGLLIMAAGIAWPWLRHVPFGRLPGDIIIDRPGFRFFFPLMSMLLVSALLSFLLWLLRR